MFPTEKIHGSNISIIIDNDDNIDVAKRTAFLTELEREQRPWNTLATFADEQKSSSSIGLIKYVKSHKN